MKLFTIKLSDEERERLERHRAALGLRAQTDVIRTWIAGALETPDDRVRNAHASFGRSVDTARATIADFREAVVEHAAKSVEVPFGPIKRATPKAEKGKRK